MEDELEYDKFNVKGIKNDSLVVNSFKLKKMSKYMEEELAKI